MFGINATANCRKTFKKHDFATDVCNRNGFDATLGFKNQIATNIFSYFFAVCGVFLWFARFCWSCFLCCFKTVVLANVLKTQKVYNRPDAAASFFWVFFQNPKKDIACSRTGGVWAVVGCAKKAIFLLF